MALDITRYSCVNVGRHGQRQGEADPALLDMLHVMEQDPLPMQVVSEDARCCASGESAS